MQQVTRHETVGAYFHFSSCQPRGNNVSKIPSLCFSETTDPAGPGLLARTNRIEVRHQGLMPECTSRPSRLNPFNKNECRWDECLECSHGSAVPGYAILRLPWTDRSSMDPRSPSGLDCIINQSLRQSLVGDQPKPGDPPIIAKYRSNTGDLCLHANHAWGGRSEDVKRERATCKPRCIS